MVILGQPYLETIGKLGYNDNRELQEVSTTDLLTGIYRSRLPV